MFTVALIGPDGSGKTTITRHLEGTLSLPAKYLYMGVSTDSSNRMLPTTWLVHVVKRALGAGRDNAGPPDSRKLMQRPRSRMRRVFRGVKSCFSVAKLLSEEWFRQGLAWYYQLRGYVVLFDRDYFSDYYAYHIADNGQYRTAAQRVHGWILKHIYPKPALVVYLDAPAQLLHERKGEGTVELLERRRHEYLDLQNVVPNFATVDGTRPIADVAREVAELVLAHHGSRCGMQTRGSDVTC